MSEQETATTKQREQLLDLLMPDFYMVGPDVVGCFMCVDNDADSHNAIVRIAMHQWKAAP